MTKRIRMTIDQIRAEQKPYFESMGEDVTTLGIMALVDVEDMGWCRDGVTRWYHFTNEDGEPAVYYKH